MGREQRAAMHAGLHVTLPPSACTVRKQGWLFTACPANAMTLPPLRFRRSLAAGAGPTSMTPQVFSLAYLWYTNSLAKWFLVTCTHKVAFMHMGTGRAGRHTHI